VFTKRSVPKASVLQVLRSEDGLWGCRFFGNHRAAGSTGDYTLGYHNHTINSIVNEYELFRVPKHT
jgi:hypothetical protein